MFNSEIQHVRIRAAIEGYCRSLNYLYEFYRSKYSLDERRVFPIAAEITRAKNHMDLLVIDQNIPQELVERYIKTTKKQKIEEVTEGLPKAHKPNIKEELMKSFEEMRYNSMLSKVSEYRFILQERMHQVETDEEYMVFDTLTTRPEHHDEVFKKGSRLFESYRRRFLKIAQTTGEYFAVTEQGAEHGREHIHIIWFLKEMNFNDPNKGKDFPNKREIIPLRQAWPYGLSQPISVRYSADNYGRKLNWKWPIKDGKPIEVKPPEAISNYLTKYITKAYGNKKGKYTWRTKKTNSLGRNRLTKAISTLSTPQLVNLVMKERVMITKESKLISSKLLQSIALKQLKNRGSERLLINLAQSVPSRPTLNQLLTGSILPTLNHSLQRTTYIQTASSENTTPFEDDLQSSLELLGIQP